MRSKRLQFRAILEDDAPRIAALAGDWSIASMTARIPYPYSETQARQWIGSLGDGEFVRGIVQRGDLIGAVGYFHGEDGTAEIGYWIGRPWWGLGYATEAAEALVRYCFAKAGFSRLTCCHFIDNEASQRVVAKLGFEFVGPCVVYCEARRREVRTLAYEKKRPRFARLRGRIA